MQTENLQSRSSDSTTKLHQLHKPSNKPSAPAPAHIILPQFHKANKVKPFNQFHNNTTRSPKNWTLIKGATLTHFLGGGLQSIPSGSGEAPSCRCFGGLFTAIPATPPAPAAETRRAFAGTRSKTRTFRVRIDRRTRPAAPCDQLRRSTNGAAAGRGRSPPPERRSEVLRSSHGTKNWSLGEDGEEERLPNRLPLSLFFNRAGSLGFVLYDIIILFFL